MGPGHESHRPSTNASMRMYQNRIPKLGVSLRFPFKNKAVNASLKMHFYSGWVHGHVHPDNKHTHTRMCFHELAPLGYNRTGGGPRDRKIRAPFSSANFSGHRGRKLSTKNLARLPDDTQAIYPSRHWPMRCADKLNGASRNPPMCHVFVSQCIVPSRSTMYLPTDQCV